MEFSNVIRKRYSCKKFSEKQLTSEQLNEILEAGRYAPTAKNAQEQHIYVIQSTEGLQMIDEITPCRYGAPTVLVVTFDKTQAYTYPESAQTSGAEDAAIVATHMMLAATNTNVDNCWINKFFPHSLAQKMNLPENEEILMLLDLGFAAEGIGPLPNHSSRKPLCETVTYW